MVLTPTEYYVNTTLSLFCNDPCCRINLNTVIYFVQKSDTVEKQSIIV